MSAKEFYVSNNLTKYPEGKLNQCKKCLTMHVDNWKPDTYLWILQEIDVPYIPKEWNKILAKYANSTSMSGTTVLGRYLARMKLNQYSEYRWKDTEYLQQLADHEIAETMKKQGYSAAEIDETLKKGTVPIPEKPAETSFEPSEPDFPPPEVDFGNPLVDELTDEDKKYLLLKWGKTYRPDEWIQLEQLYTEMLDSYDIQAAGDRNTLMLACKSSLKANQLLDLGDIDGAQKATKMYDSLMKSGKWTAAQNKAEASDGIDSVGELVNLCEKKGFIPKYYTAGPQDHVDRVLEDLQKYTYDLIMKETGLGTMIEQSLKDLETEKERIEAAANAPEGNEEDDMFNYDKNVMVSDEDFKEFADMQEELTAEDIALLEEDER